MKELEACVFSPAHSLAKVFKLFGLFNCVQLENKQNHIASKNIFSDFETRLMGVKVFLGSLFLPCCVLLTTLNK